MKKLVSLLLALLMVASLFTVASAEIVESFDPFGDPTKPPMDLYIIASESCKSFEDDNFAVHMQYMAQHFIPSMSEFTGVNLAMKYGAGSGVMHFEIRKGDANGEAVFQKDVEVVAKGDIATWYTFDFGEAVTVTPGEKYALAFWFTSRTRDQFCYAVGQVESREGLDMWRHKRFAHGGEDKTEGVQKGDLYEVEDVTLKTTGYSVGFDLLTPEKVAAYKVDEMISALPETITVEHEEQIVSCVTAYGMLSQGEKAFVKKLDALNAAMAALDAAKEKYAKDVEEATKVETLINALPTPTDVTVSDTDAVDITSNAYNALTKDQKAMVSAEAKKKLTEVTAALKKIVDAKAVADVEALIHALPTPTDLTLEDEQAVLDAKDAYEALTKEQKDLLNKDLAEKLTKLFAVVDEWSKYGMGDINADGAVDAKDALIALKISVKKVNASYIEFLVADIDANEKVDAKDALEMLKFSVKKPSLLDEFYTIVM